MIAHGGCVIRSMPPARFPHRRSDPASADDQEDLLREVFRVRARARPARSATWRPRRTSARRCSRNRPSPAYFTRRARGPRATIVRSGFGGSLPEDSGLGGRTSTSEEWERRPEKLQWFRTPGFGLVPEPGRVPTWVTIMARPSPPPGPPSPGAGPELEIKDAPLIFGQVWRSPGPGARPRGHGLPEGDHVARRRARLGQGDQHAVHPARARPDRAARSS